MSEISIKLNIGNRTYPLTIQAHEEETIRQAAKLVNDQVKHLQENYAVKDMQDLLAMAALQVASRGAAQQPQAPVTPVQPPVDLAELDELLSTALNKS